MQDAVQHDVQHLYLLCAMWGGPCKDPAWLGQTSMRDPQLYWMASEHHAADTWQWHCLQWHTSLGCHAVLGQAHITHCLLMSSGMTAGCTVHPKRAGAA
jgi:hypothetical protein